MQNAGCGIREREQGQEQTQDEVNKGNMHAQVNESTDRFPRA